MSDSEVMTVGTFAEGAPHDEKCIAALDAETLSVWKLYLLSVASFGLYLPFWVYRRAKLNGEGSEFKSTPGWWGFGVFVAPVACAILYEFSRKADLVAGEDHGWKWQALPSFLLAGILLASFLISSMPPLVALFFVLPIPFLIVQSRINSSYCSQVEPITVSPFRLGVRHWILIVLGLPMVMALWWISDPTAYSTLLARPLPKYAVVQGYSGDYELTTPDGGWKRVKSGTIMGEETDLEVVGPGMATWLIVFRPEERGMGLDEMVSFRRGWVFSTGDPVTYSEERYFLESSDLVPASLALYRNDVFGLESYLVLTAELDSGLVEVIGYTLEPDSYSQIVRQFVTSFVEVESEAGL